MACLDPEWTSGTCAGKAVHNRLLNPMSHPLTSCELRTLYHPSEIIDLDSGGMRICAVLQLA